MYENEGAEGVVGLSDPDMGVDGDEMQAVIEIEGEEISSLQNEICVLKRMHGEACQGWSKYQRLHERDQEALKMIRDVAKAALSLSLTHAEKGGLLKLIKECASDRLPLPMYDDGDIPF